MDKETFEKQYIENSGITKEEFDQYFITMECNCNYEGCRGWAVINNDPVSIKCQKELYS